MENDRETEDDGGDREYGYEGYDEEDEEDDVFEEGEHTDRERAVDDAELRDFEERLKDSEAYEVEAEVFDEPTLRALYKLVHDGHVRAVGGVVSSGKEANIVEADGADGEVALKIYRVATSSFGDMRKYLEGDPRFEGARSKKELVVEWVRREFSNLRLASEAGVRVPEPMAHERNVLVSEFIGEDGVRAPQIREVEIENPETCYDVVVEYASRLHDAGLVHGDLSEYNVLVHDGELVVIDMGQTVRVEHPRADDLLENDCENVARFFSSLGVETSRDEVLKRVTG
ncbi:MAG: serine protein kinase RIO [Halobacteriales archaeon]|nr:serine protein kinase RIO [Halobacteriales archaeon]